ncbi:hypothetical protein CEB94_39435 [Streptomyces hawaiiensis]|uniref:Uncharacterized protein n=1 Tax=Streptomyces hawaiiensis TaxID=67305 RepID=A0A6G5RQ76_9ACTN|nr:hypothetical protein CEB94_39435 [Streptomyces hawaiiensis]
MGRDERGTLVRRRVPQDHAQCDQVTDGTHEVGRRVAGSSDEADQKPRHQGDNRPSSVPSADTLDRLAAALHISGDALAVLPGCASRPIGAAATWTTI